MRHGRAAHRDRDDVVLRHRGIHRLLRRLGGGYAEALTAQRASCATRCALHGREMGTEGDSFFVVFDGRGERCTRPSRRSGSWRRTLAAAASGCGCGWASTPVARRCTRTATSGWTSTGPPGSPARRTAARSCCRPRRGGSATAACRTARRCVDLGRHRLKDIPEPEHLYQLVATGWPRLPAAAQPRRTTRACRSRRRRSSAVTARSPSYRAARDAERAAGDPDRARWRGQDPAGDRGGARAGGAFPDGVYFVPLAAVTTAEVMWTTIAEMLGSATTTAPADGSSARWRTAARCSCSTTSSSCRPRPGGRARAARRRPGLVVVATSRRPLHLYGEHEHPVPPLTAAGDRRRGRRGAGRSGAVQLFVQRAQHRAARLRARRGQRRRRRRDLPAARRAAAGHRAGRRAHASCWARRALLARLSADLEPAARRRPAGPPADAARDHRLEPRPARRDQQAFFRRLGVFAGGADLEAVAAVTAGPTTRWTLSPSWSTPACRRRERQDGEPRFTLLQTLPAYAQDELGRPGERPTPVAGTPSTTSPWPRGPLLC